MFRDAFLKINVDNYRHNIQYLKNIHQKELIAVIKANAYGLVDDVMARYINEAHVDTIAVSSLDEAIHLRKANIKGDIIILSYVSPFYLDLIRKYQLTIVTVSKDYILSLMSYDLTDIHFEIKIDSGMHRIGLYKEEVNESIDLLLSKKAYVDGIFTHYAKSDNDDDFTNKQYQYFKDVLANTKHQFKRIHTSNTDATIHFNDEVSTHVRCGLGLLGYSSYISDLKPVVGLYAKIINIRKINAHEAISYGQKYPLGKSEYIATLPIGYADGVLRKFEKLPVYLNDKYYHIAGSICMDQMMIIADENTKLHDEVEIFGEHIKLEDVANKLDTISYEILTGLSDRLYRQYYENGQLVLEICPRYR